MKTNIKFKKGDSATLEDLSEIFKYLPLGVRKNHQPNMWKSGQEHISKDMETEDYFVVDCEIIIKQKGDLKRMITTKRKNYDTEEEEFAFGDGFRAGIIAMCKKYNISESDVYKKEKGDLK